VQVAVIMNARAGSFLARQRPEAVFERAGTVLERLGAEPRFLLTEHPGQARNLARRAADEGADVVCAWGGDGTVNEVAGGLVGTSAVLGVVPAGSGNGLARDLGIPMNKDSALAVAARGATRMVDCGELNGRLFFNVAGFGFDAYVAHAFAQGSLGVRGLASYIAIGLHGAWQYEARPCAIAADGEPVWSAPAMLVAMANMRQWGSDALVAPMAKPDDGELDLIVVPAHRKLYLTGQLWRLWHGSIGDVPGVMMRTFRRLELTAETALPVQVDGEPAGHAERVTVTVRPRALRVRVPAAAASAAT
jgi:YegS/Rv2252/BmrU family lipid kinase